MGQCKCWSIAIPQYPHIMKINSVQYPTTELCVGRLTNEQINFPLELKLKKRNAPLTLMHIKALCGLQFVLFSIYSWITVLSLVIFKINKIHCMFKKSMLRNAKVDLRKIQAVVTSGVKLIPQYKFLSLLLPTKAIGSEPSWTVMYYTLLWNGNVKNEKSFKLQKAEM